MKRLLYAFTALIISITSLQAQTLVLHINGDMPDTLGDKTGNNTMNNINGVYLDNGALAFGPVINTYLSTDSLYQHMAINQDWTFECKLMVSDSTDEVALIDFRSTSQTGNMYLYYNRNNKGLHFSDRNLNGDAGHLVADYMMLPQNVWVNIKLERANGRLKLFRDWVMTADTAFTDTLSPIATTTIGYSEDRRVTHELFWMDDIKIYAGSPNSVRGVTRPVTVILYPNPAAGHVSLRTTERVLEVSVWDMQARNVTTGFSRDVDISGLPPGAYTITALTASGKMLTGTFLKD